MLSEGSNTEAWWCVPQLHLSDVRQLQHNTSFTPANNTLLLLHTHLAVVASCCNVLAIRGVCEHRHIIEVSLWSRKEGRKRVWQTSVNVHACESHKSNAFMSHMVLLHMHHCHTCCLNTAESDCHSHTINCPSRAQPKAIHSPVLLKATEVMRFSEILPRHQQT